MIESLREWFRGQSARGQMLFGCLSSLALAACCLYGLGAASYLVRPYLFSSPLAAATVIPHATNTLAPTPTDQPLVTMALPGTTLVATPTQAPLPTRAPTSTSTPAEIPTITPPPFESGTPSLFPTDTETPPVIATTPAPPTRTPGPTNTVRPTKTKKPTATKAAPVVTPGH